ncbi:MAG: rod shape-determining protein RodA [Deltaproteobacteria bacterium]|nr:rod shape-determining protein RodA [Deltaproteobacteria bacterium]
MIDRRLFTHFDWFTFSLTAALTAIGLASVYSATHAQMPAIYKKEVYWIIIGLAGLAAAVTINYLLLERLAYALWGGAVILLVSVLFIGKTTAGARRWLNLGLFSLQPSELAKLALIIALAKYFTSRPVPSKGLALKDLALPAVFLLVPFLLVVKQPDLGTAIILWLIFWTMTLMVRVRTRTLVGIVAVFMALTPIAWKMLKGYQKARLMSFLDPAKDPLGTGYHVMQSKIAIGSGGIFGKGFTNGTQGNLMFLPEHHTDFIFAVYAEEWGLAGSMVLLSLFLILILNGFNAANDAKDRFGFLVAFGMTTMLFWHVAINLGMVSGMLPVVGVPLPFISYGGSFLVTAMIAAGLIINIKMRGFMF